MKRNMELIRKILLWLEQHNDLDKFEGCSTQEVTYHVSLLEEAGLITQGLYNNMLLNDCILDGIRISWAGHEFLDAARNASIWEKAKSIAIEKTGALSFEMLKFVLLQLGKDAIAASKT